MKKTYNIREMMPVVLMIGLTAICSYLVPGFFSLANFMVIFKQSAFSAIISIGMLFVFIAGEVDLSVGAQFSLYGILCAVLMQNHINDSTAIALTLLFAVALGCVVGYSVAKMRVKAILTTIAVSVVLQGATYTISKGIPIFNISQRLVRAVTIEFKGMSTPVIVMIICGLIASLFLHHTYYGKYMYAVGENSYAAEHSGISSQKTKIMAFGMCSLFTAVSSIVFLGRIGSTSLTAGVGLELDALTAAALSGVSFSGGKGKVLPIITGAIFLGVMSSAFIALDLASYYQNFIKGTVLFCAVLTNRRKS